MAYQALRDAVAKVSGRVIVAQINEQDKQNITAELDFEIRRDLFLRVELGYQNSVSVHLTLVDGPFSLLDGLWRFVPLGTPADATAPACRIEFEMRYAFTSRALEALISPVFDRIADTFVDSFVKRAEGVHGQS